MATLTFQLNNKSDIQLVITLIERLGGTIDFADKMENFEEEVNNTELFGVLDKIAEKGELSKSIKDPVEWQREIRKDRILPFRD